MMEYGQKTVILLNFKTMKQSLKCYLGSHNYEIKEVYDLKDVRENLIGKVIINRCIHCGKIKVKTVYTTECYGNSQRQNCKVFD